MPAPSKEENQRQKALLEERYQAKQERISGSSTQKPKLEPEAYLPPPEMLSAELANDLNDQTQRRGFNFQAIIDQAKDNPLVPFGMGVTVFALSNGLRYMVKRDTVAQQRMMRLRIFGQGFTMVSLVVGTIMLAAKK